MERVRDAVVGPTPDVEFPSGNGAVDELSTGTEPVGDVYVERPETPVPDTPVDRLGNIPVELSVGYGALEVCEPPIGAAEVTAPVPDKDEVKVNVDEPCESDGVADVAVKVKLVPGAPLPETRLEAGRLLFDKGYGALDVPDCVGKGLVGSPFPVPGKPDASVVEEFVEKGADVTDDGFVSVTTLFVAWVDSNEAFDEAVGTTPDENSVWVDERAPDDKLPVPMIELVPFVMGYGTEDDGPREVGGAGEPVTSPLPVEEAVAEVLIGGATDEDPDLVV
ncbi:hypothetical protein B0T25DRAFT_562641 [Lasiosphaeria hispida]|uniref:Uncharacterized protein n=1 Tax=Lasiosphaeria hispida TaxID=260671 RepID=A0AAJ0HVH4_9PEZI|nr:hypothetical protein B0T25DRAFT_562641 [Lasiosphaeria hispida]